MKKTLCYTECMKLKTRLHITFLTIILLPLVLLLLSFFSIGTYLDRRAAEYGLKDGGMPGVYESVGELSELAERVSGKASFLMVSREFPLYLLFATFIILLFTSVLLTKWIETGIFRPVANLSLAMKHISEGDLEYRLENGYRGEIGDLYDKYEDMRLRLREDTQEKLAQEKQNKELLSNITHDLKTPITAIKGYVEGIMDGVADTPEKTEKYIRTIYNKANDLDRLINELTMYSGIDNRQIPYHFHRINVTDYFNDCVEEVGLELDSEGIKLNYDNFIDKDTLIIADPEQMKKVVNNIVGNSVKYMEHDHGIIDIRLLDEVDSVRVEIEDNGKGIAAKDLPNIFERFYRADASRNSTTGGSGIGLSIVKRIIEDHGGYIWATGKEGEGTCIHFVIRKYVEKPQESDNVIVDVKPPKERKKKPPLEWRPLKREKGTQV